MPQADLENALKSKGIKNFVDPRFPPLDSSVYDTLNDNIYPFENIVKWKRPKEFMKNP